MGSGLRLSCILVATILTTSPVFADHIYSYEGERYIKVSGVGSQGSSSSARGFSGGDAARSASRSLDLSALSPSSLVGSLDVERSDRTPAALDISDEQRDSKNDFRSSTSDPGDLSSGMGCGAVFHCIARSIDITRDIDFASPYAVTRVARALNVQGVAPSERFLQADAPTALVPEPSSVLIFAGGAFVMLRRRRSSQAETSRS